MNENEILKILKQVIRADQSATSPLAFTVPQRAIYAAPSPSILASLIAALPSGSRDDAPGSTPSHFGWAAAAGEALSGSDRRLGSLPALVINGEGDETMLMADITQKPRMASQSGKLALGLRLMAPPFPAGAVYVASFLAVRATGDAQMIDTDHVITVGVEANFGTPIEDPQLQREWRNIAQIPWQELPLRIVLRKISERSEETAKAA